MCTESSQVCFPEFNSQDELIKVAFDVPAKLYCNNGVADGFELPSSLNQDGELVITLKIKKDPLITFEKIETQINHVFDISVSQLTALGVDENTKIKFEYVTDVTPSERTKWKYVCTTRCWTTIYGQYICETKCFWVADVREFENDFCM
ncbi:MAG: hypothetical protein WC055_02165 [Melioribacteraceae bacterium]